MPMRRNFGIAGVADRWTVLAAGAECDHTSPRWQLYCKSIQALAETSLPTSDKTTLARGPKPIGWAVSHNDSGPRECKGTTHDRQCHSRLHARAGLWSETSSAFARSGRRRYRKT